MIEAHGMSCPVVRHIVVNKEACQGVEVAVAGKILSSFGRTTMA